MGEVLRFFPKSQRDRARLIREARAICDSIFPPNDPVREQQDKIPLSHTVGGPILLVTTRVSRDRLGRRIDKYHLPRMSSNKNRRSVPGSSRI